ncbi:hypothetical protein ACOSQ2_019613 [Xanthoceras sorbifolium]
MHQIQYYPLKVNQHNQCIEESRGKRRMKISLSQPVELVNLKKRVFWSFKASKKCIFAIIIMDMVVVKFQHLRVNFSIFPCINPGSYWLPANTKTIPLAIMTATKFNFGLMALFCIVIISLLQFHECKSSNIFYNSFFHYNFD